MDKCEPKNPLITNTKWLLFYKLFWIFILMSFVGYLLETIAFFFYDGKFVSRQGVIYGPFSVIYGMGAVLLIWGMHRWTHKSFLFITLLCAFIAGFFEYIASLFMEKAFGVIYWQYSDSIVNLYGRTNLVNDIAWGILGAIVVKIAYPKFVEFFDRRINKRIIVFTWIFLVFFVFNLYITMAATNRLTQRHNGIPATNAYQRFLDKYYPDDYIKSLIPVKSVN